MGSLKTSRDCRAGGLLALPALYVCTLFSSAFLLFLIQPLFAKLVLPLLGGSPGVWNTCMVFFQSALLAGYAYAHFVSRRASVVWQVVLQVAILALAFAVLPIQLGNSQPPASTTPVFWLLQTLALAVGAPFVVLATTGPLLQQLVRTAPWPPITARSPTSCIHWPARSPAACWRCSHTL